MRGKPLYYSMTGGNNMRDKTRKQESKKTNARQSLCFCFFVFLFSSVIKMKQYVFQPKRNSVTSGFTLIELVVGIGIFALVLTSIMGIFQQVIRVERRAVNAQNAQENVRYVMEVISKEIRTAERNFGTCVDVPNGDIFAVDVGVGNDKLYLKNQYGECVTYFLEGNRFKIMRGSDVAFVTSDETVIEYLNFSLKADDQPAVTITMGIQTLDTTATDVTISMQTTISSRYYLEDDVL